MKHSASRWIIWAIGTITLVLLAGIAFNLTPYLRGPDSWRWAYAVPGWPWRHLVPGIVVALYCVWVIWAQRHPPIGAGATARYLGLVAVSISLIQAAILFPESPDVVRPLFYRTISAGESGLFTVGSRIQDLGAFLHDYPALMPTFPVHPQRYPPGLPALFYLARKILEMVPGFADRVGLGLRLYQCQDLQLMRLPNATIATALIQMLLPVVSGLVVFPLYGLAKEVAGKPAALFAAALYPIVPSFALWSARWDQLYPVISCTAWYLFYHGFVRGRRGYLLTAGLALGLGSFLNFSLVTMMMPLGLTGVLWVVLFPEYRRWRTLVIGAAAFFLGLVLPWAIYQLVVGNGFVDIWRVAMSYHLGLARDYWTWLGYHPYDFLLFLGLPIAGLFVAGAVRSLLRPRCAASAFSLALSLSLVLLILGGVARGEVARVWLFLTPFPVIVAASLIVRWSVQPRYVAAVFGLLALQLLVLNAFLRVVTTGVVDPPKIPWQAEVPAQLHPSEARFGAQVALVGYAFHPKELKPGAPLQLTLAWKALRPLSVSYTVFNHLRLPSGSPVAQYDNLPMQGGAPTTCWRPGRIIVDHVVIDVPAELEPGTYQLVTGLYNLDTGERLAVVGADATPDDAVLLATFDLVVDNGGEAAMIIH